MQLTALNSFNAGLEDLREEFHKTGRLDDSNTKLDEIVKLICLEVASVFADDSQIPSLQNILDDTRGVGVVKRINKELKKIATLPIFSNAKQESLLGVYPKLSLPETEDDIARRMAQLVVDTFNVQLRTAHTPKAFELVNESFGAFVRDNFRNNIEDAQYMTPPEVVNFMCELAIDEIKNMKGFKGITVCDPSCGVGSFLAHFYKIFIQDPPFPINKLTLVGQDKVDRMARLAKLNLLLFGNRSAVIERGNSLIPSSVLDSYKEQCDIILTNPPFGARFHSTELSLHSSDYFTVMHNLIQSTNANLDSELLFLDRYLGLLRPGGSAFVVVPDAIISATRVQKMMRDYLAEKCTVVSITELPPVTFAQAGTRTKTCVLHFKKKQSEPKDRVFLSYARSVGFDVASRKGVPYKKYEGTDDLPLILETMRANKKTTSNGSVIHSTAPSSVSVLHSRLAGEPWTPNHHSAIRYSTLKDLSMKSKHKNQTMKLSDIVELPNKYVRRAKTLSGAKCISVLHIKDFGFLNIKELMEYEPKYPGQPCQPNDILFSKINPRIPRAIVVPDLGFALSCSTEFEVMRAKKPHSPYEIMMLLLSQDAQAQIQSLTSGTSSSHNRIKTEQLMNVVLPMAEGTGKEGQYKKLIGDFGKAHLALTNAIGDLYKNWDAVNKIFSE